MPRRSRNNSRQINDALSKLKTKEIMFNLTPNSIDNLQNTIQTCIKNKTKLLVYTSMGDNTSKELCQIPEVQNLFSKACTDHGLLGLWVLHWSLDPDFCSHQLRLLCQIICGKFINSNGINFDYSIDVKEFLNLLIISGLKFKTLYGTDIAIDRKFLCDLILKFNS